MGFPSPAKDCAEGRLDWNEVMGAHYEGSLIVETADGLVVVDTSILNTSFLTIPPTAVR